MVTPQEVVQSAREVLLGPSTAARRWEGHSAELVGDALQVVFTWRLAPYRYAIRIRLDELAQGVWTGTPGDTAVEQVRELAGLVLEELDTGAAVWARRRVHDDGLVELLLDRPRVAALPPGRHGVFSVSDRGADGVWFAREQGLDIGPVERAIAAGQLSAWWVASVDDRRGRPVAQAVMTRRGPDAELSHLDVRDDVGLAVPEAVVVELVYSALWHEVARGARVITSGLRHQALDAAGFAPDGEGWTWRADGPVLLPPELVLPFR